MHMFKDGTRANNERNPSDLSGVTIRIGKGNERKHNGCLFAMNRDIYSAATSLFACKNNISEMVFFSDCNS